MDQRAWIALLLVKGIGPVMGRKLLDAFGHPENILAASAERLRAAGASKAAAQAVTSFDNWKEVDQNLATLERIGAHMVPLGSDAYPRHLAQIHDPPLVLFVKGDLSEQDDLAVAVVGTRRPGGYAKRIARKLSFQIASSGVTIVSGLALGIDGQAHQGAMDAKGRTIAVLGSGLDRISPDSHRPLARVIAQNGAVVSEFLPETEPRPSNFPRRNRVVAGLSASVLVIAMPAKSGAGITAKAAVDQNKDVLIVPGPIDDPDFAGSHRWIRQGARPVFDAMDVLEEVLPDAALRMGREGPLLVDAKSKQENIKLPADQATVYKELGSEPIHIDAIASGSGLTIEQVSTILLELELRNFIVQMPGKMFRLNQEA